MSSRHGQKRPFEGGVRRIALCAQTSFAFSSWWCTRVVSSRAGVGRIAQLRLLELAGLCRALPRVCFQGNSPSK